MRVEGCCSRRVDDTQMLSMHKRHDTKLDMKDEGHGLYSLIDYFWGRLHCDVGARGREGGARLYDFIDSIVCADVCAHVCASLNTH